MKFKAVILDLDQTLVDSSRLEGLRKQRKWNLVLQSLDSIIYDEAFKTFFAEITKKNIKIGIITNSPRNYATAVLNHFDIPYDHLIAYHDVVKRKPDPEPFVKIITALKIQNSNCVSVGDHDNDILASKKAGISTIGAKWYTKGYTFSEQPDYTLNSIIELYNLILN